MIYKNNKRIEHGMSWKKVLVIGVILGLLVSFATVVYLRSVENELKADGYTVLHESKLNIPAVDLEDLFNNPGLQFELSPIPVADNYYEQRTAHVHVLEPKVSDAYLQGYWTAEKGFNPQVVGLNK